MRRTLIIGLGSTGRDICDDILRRILWSSGNNTLDKVPWVDVRVLETEQKDGLPSKEHQKYVDLVPRQQDVERMMNHPGEFSDSLDLTRWSDGDLMRKVPNIARGAGGMRMAGRMAFFEPNVFARVRESLRDALVQLNGVDIAEIRRVMSNPPSSLSLDTSTQVLVVGSVGGGTASGCFIDVAYLVRQIASDLGYPIDLNGYFTLPALATGDNVLKANTFAALLECNHFLTTGVTYRTRFPDSNGKDYTNNGLPFDRTSLAQTPTGMPYSEFKTLIGDYLYSLAVSVDFSVIAGRAIDGAVFMSGVDKVGSTRRWATIGIRALESPADRLVEGCSLRLVKNTLDHLLAPPHEIAPVSRLSTNGLDAGSLKKQLETEALKSEIAARIGEQSEVLPAQIALASTLVQNPDGRSGLLGMPQGHVATRLGGKTAEARRGLAGRLANDRSFVDPDISLPTLSARLGRLAEEIRAELGRIEKTNQAGDTVAGVARKEAEEKAKAVVASPLTPQGKGCLGLWRRPAKSDPVAQSQIQKIALQTLTDSLVDEHLNNVARPAMYRDALEIIGVWQGRIEGDAVRPGIRRQLEAVRDIVTDRLLRVQGDLQSVQSDYLSAADIETEYQAQRLRAASGVTTEAAAEREWQKTLIASLDLVPAELTRPKGESIYDPPTDDEAVRTRARQIGDTLTKAAQPYFGDVLRRPIMDMLGNPDAALQWLGGVDVMLQVNTGDPSQWQPVQAKQVSSFLFYDENALATTNLRQKPLFQKQIGEMTRRDPRLNEVNSLNPHRISMIKDFSGFSLNAVGGCGPGGQFRQAFEDMNTQAGQERYSRRDVSWTPISARDMKNYQQCRHLFLVGLAGGFVTTRRAGLYEFQYRGTRPEVLIFDSLQWADNASRLYTGKDASQQLLLKIEEWLRKDGAAQVVASMHSYAHEKLHAAALQDGNGPLTAVAFLESVYQFWKKYADVDREFRRVDPDIDPAQRYWFQAGQEIMPGRLATQDGLWCRSCAAFLGADNSEYVLQNPCVSCADSLLTP